MSAHKATISWRRETESFDYTEYNRKHEWHFEGISVAASAAPGYHGDAQCVDPEEALVAAVASCHMLTFLAIASRRKWVIDSYRDTATGILAKNSDGRLAITRITLRPLIEFGSAHPDEDALLHAHELSHKECFIANTVNCEIHVEPEPK